MLIDIAAGVAIGILSGMGIGGGGLLVIYLTAVRNYAQLGAQAANLLFFVFAASAALPIHMKKRNIDFVLVAVFAVSGVVGSLAGARLAALAPEKVIRKAFGAMLIVSGGITFARSIRDKKAGKH